MNRMISNHSVVKAVQGLSIADLGAESVALDANSGQYYGLNPVGAYVLEKIKTEKVVKDVVSDVAQRFGVDHEVASADVMSFLVELEAAELLTVVDAAN
jgi:hypothetical protein